MAVAKAVVRCHMRYTQLITSKSCPRSVRSRGHELLQRGGFVRQLSQGLFSFLPLGTRVVARITKLIRDELEGLGGQEVLLPLVNPASIWKKSGREILMRQELVRFSDASGHEMVLAPTHEEAMVELVRSVVTSYRQLPAFLFQFQTKYRNEGRPKGGLLRTREFVMSDAYSFHRSASELNNFFPRVFAAYERVFAACNVPVLTADASVGSMLGDRSLEFLMPTDIGDARIVTCQGCGYAANEEVAVGSLPVAQSQPRSLEHVETGDAATIPELEAMLHCGRDRLTKTMAFLGSESLVLAVVRGDQEVSQEKLATAVHESAVRLASRDWLVQLGIDPVSIGPIDFPRDLLEMDLSVQIVVDSSVAETPNLIVACNEPHTRLANVNFGRDFDADIVEDIARVGAGSRCRVCGAELSSRSVVELGNIFKLGTYYSHKLKLSIVDSGGRRFYPSIGAYGIGIGRLMAAIAEANHDKRGIAWPRALAPFSLFLMGIGRSTRVTRVLEDLHDQLGSDVLLDDRSESISTKIKDADLIGIPYRMIVSARTLERGKVEILERRSRAIHSIDLQNAVDSVKGMVEDTP